MSVEDTALLHPDVVEFMRIGKPSLIVTDVDGTLLNPAHEVTARTLEVLKKVTGDLQIPVLFATGKTFPSTMHVRKELGMLDDPRCIGLNVNGLVIHDHTGKTIQSTTIDASISTQIFRMAWARGHAVVIYCDDRILSRDHNAFVDILPHYGEPACELVSDLEEKVSTGKEKANKVMILVPIEDQILATDEYIAQLDATKVSATCAEPGMIEFLPFGMNKAVALQNVCDMLKVDISRVMTFGDGNNDKEMLRASGLGCAMGNGRVETKAAANVTIGSNVESGQAKFLAKLFGI